MLIEMTSLSVILRVTYRLSILLVLLSMLVVGMHFSDNVVVISLLFVKLWLLKVILFRKHSCLWVGCRSIAISHAIEVAGCFKSRQLEVVQGRFRLGAQQTSKAATQRPTTVMMSIGYAVHLSFVLLLRRCCGVES